MKLAPYYRNYELLVDKAESFFQGVEKEYGQCIKCELHCSECCNAVFGLFIIEAAYIREHFEHIDDVQKGLALERAKAADHDLESLYKKLNAFEDDPTMQAYTMARERIRCPLLDDQDECILYHRRPITCRVYGIPTKVQGKSRVCGKSGFKEGKNYPIFSLDGIYRDMFLLSKEMLDEAGIDSDDKAALLLSISKVIQIPLNDLIEGDFKS